MVKVIDIAHHLDDYECMWNGIEDLYMAETGEALPSQFFFVLSGFGSFCYLRTERSKLKRMVAFGDGRTAKMYAFLAPLAGFDFKFHSHRTFELGIGRAKKEIDAGHPVIIGALDMYYLPYYTKLYHKDHIPFHYIMMVGYDDEKSCISLYDCGRKERLSLSYEALRMAWHCSYPGLSKPYTLCSIRMINCKDKLAVAKAAFAVHKAQFLDPPTSCLGYKGMEKMIREMPQWKEELTKADYDLILQNMVMFLGTVPELPNALRGIKEPDERPYYGGFDKVSLVLREMARAYDLTDWEQAADVFETGCTVVEKIKETIVAYLTEEKDETDQLPQLFSQVKEIMLAGYTALSV